MVDEALVETGTVQRRVRDLPARVVVYLLLAGCLFGDLGYRQVWDRLVAGLGSIRVPNPAATMTALVIFIRLYVRAIYVWRSRASLLPSASIHSSMVLPS